MLYQDAASSDSEQSENDEKSTLLGEPSSSTGNQQNLIKYKNVNETA